LKNENDKGNGFYDRKLGTPMGNLDISVPRTRTGDFRPHILPEPYKRVDESYTDLLMSLVVNGYSESSLLNTLKSLNLPYSIYCKIETDKVAKKIPQFCNYEFPTIAEGH